MTQAIVNLIIQLVAGWLGGTAAGRMFKNLSLGPLGDAISGLIGGVAGGQALSLLVPALGAAAGGGFDIGAFVGQIIAGGVGGGVLTAIVGFIRNLVDPTHRRHA
jgi:hypothetical protein